MPSRILVEHPSVETTPPLVINPSRTTPLCYTWSRYKISPRTTITAAPHHLKIHPSFVRPRPPGRMAHSWQTLASTSTMTKSGATTNHSGLNTSARPQAEHRQMRQRTSPSHYLRSCCKPKCAQLTFENESAGRYESLRLISLITPHGSE